MALSAGSMRRLALTVACRLTVPYTKKQSMGGFVAGATRCTLVAPLGRTTVVVRRAAQGSWGSPGRHNQTVDACWCGAGAAEAGARAKRGAAARAGSAALDPIVRTVSASATTPVNRLRADVLINQLLSSARRESVRSGHESCLCTTATINAASNTSATSPASGPPTTTSQRAAGAHAPQAG
jgi:hypothetical protein